MNQPPGGWPPGPPPGPGYGYAPPPQYPMAYAQPPGPMAWTCPFCRYQGQPARSLKTTTGGWIVFCVLLIFCFPLCWIGLTMKQQTTRCASCHTPVGTY